MAAALPRRVHRIAQRRTDGVSEQARNLLVTTAVFGPAFRREDAAPMLSKTPAALLPTVEEVMSTGIVIATDNVFSFRHELVRRALSEMIPPPARQALHRQYGQILLGRGESASALAARAVLAWDHGRVSEAVGLLRDAARQVWLAPARTANPCHP